MNIFWATLPERSILAGAARTLLGVAEHNARCGYARFDLDVNRTDVARNLLCLEFIKHSKNPSDKLVMLDCDHLYRPDIVERLASHDVGVVGALYFNRKPPHNPEFRIKGEKIPTSWAQARLVPCSMVGTGAICIRRDVFDDLINAGFPYPWFRYEYQDRGQGYFPTEDIYFGAICQKANISHYVDTSIEIPHLKSVGIDRVDYKAAQHAT